MAAKILTVPQIQISDENVFAARSNELLNSADRCLGNADIFWYESSAIFEITSTILGFQT